MVLFGEAPHLHGHLEDAEAVGERAAAREGVRPHRRPPRPPDGALRHERRLPRSAAVRGGGGEGACRRSQRQSEMIIIQLHNNASLCGNGKAFVDLKAESSGWQFN